MEQSAINLYRIVHADNVANILQNGMFCAGHHLFDPDNIFIGNRTLTNERHDFALPKAEWGNLGDYVPFYFGFRSPMLYNIHTGYNVEQQPQSDIVYIVVKLQCLIDKNAQIIFTDGHAKDTLTFFSDDLSKISKLDWTSILAAQWNNTPQFPDRKRKKQAECLVKEQVSPDCIAALVVYDEAQKQAMETLIADMGMTTKIFVNPNDTFYY